MKAAASMTLAVAPFAAIYKTKEEADKAEQEFEASIAHFNDETKESHRTMRKQLLNLLSEAAKTWRQPKN